jgi:hypothetical protein
MQNLPLACSGWRRCATLLLVLLFGTTFVVAQESDSKAPSTEELNQLVAPIALYPDSLLAQVLMASTYPLEIVEASRWLEANPGLEGKALEDAMQGQTWDPSVKSLTAFSQVLTMMNDKLDWTTQLGNAFLADQKAVMDTVQVLRQKAKDEGNLQSNEQQQVKEEATTSSSTTQTIIIEPADPKVVYVPTYNPTIVYGPWAYPAYPPYYWYPPGYVATPSVISFGLGLAVGAALWGDCNWGHARVDIDINRYNSFNRTKITNVNWKHDSSHRKGVTYGNRDLQSRYGANQLHDAKARESFRGRAEQGRQQLATGQADLFKGRSSEGVRDAAAGRLGASARSGSLESKARSLSRPKTSSAASHLKGRGSALGGLGSGHESLRHSTRGLQSRGGLSRSGGGLGSRRGGLGGRRRR